ncbi:GNAT family N-acetyltransferase [Bizionia sp. KMM 8389]
MLQIIKANRSHAALLANIGETTFLESHGSSAPKQDILDYISNKLTSSTFETELEDSDNSFHIAYYNGNPVGYSKIIFSSALPHLPFKNITKLERIYILEAFHNLKIGRDLFHFNRNLAMKNNQVGMWLYVWTENKKAISFYKKAGFKIIDTYQFKISKNHSNPNHQMLLEF